MAPKRTTTASNIDEISPPSPGDSLLSLGNASGAPGSSATDRGFSRPTTTTKTPNELSTTAVDPISESRACLLLLQDIRTSNRRQPRSWLRLSRLRYRRPRRLRSLAVDPKVHPGEIAIAEITGDNAAKLSRSPLRNCAGIAPIEVMKILGVLSVGLSLILEKGLPLGSGLGSNAAAAAAAVAVNEIFGGKLGFDELVAAGMKSEEKDSGYHADNIAPAIMRGLLFQAKEILRKPPNC